MVVVSITIAATIWTRIVIAQTSAIQTSTAVATWFVWRLFELDIQRFTKNFSR
jgi:hypothetical protein